MSADHSPEYLRDLVAQLRFLPSETEWVEFKHNRAVPQEIGEYISALSNMAALRGKAHGYVVWGVRDGTHAPVGTTFRPGREKKGNEDLEAWLTRGLRPHTGFRFHEFDDDGKPFVVLEIDCATQYPVQFDGEAYVRVGSYVKKLKDHPVVAAQLYERLRSTAFETLRAAEHRTTQQVLDLLDYPAFFTRLRLPLPTSPDLMAERLAEHSLITANDAGRWDITNLGALLFARDLRAFPGLRRKSVRVIEYEGRNRSKTKREQEGRKGYAAGFAGLMKYIHTLVPRNEVIGQALREDIPMYPDLALRELVANALIHQDLSVGGAGPTVELFSDRVEITNPGLPLVTPLRFLGTAPRSRNEALASFMRLVGYCEERGSGIYKVVQSVEAFQLPAPLFEADEHATRAVLFAHKGFGKMSRDEKVKACYWHACLRYADREQLTNTTLRERFGLDAGGTPTVSRIIREAVKAKLIKPFDPEQRSRGLMSYVPIWA